jgi:hypothetical protein
VAIDPDAPTSPASTVEGPVIENELPTYRAIHPLSIISLALGVLAILCFADLWFLIVAAAAVGAGLLAERAIRRLPNELTGRGFAQAGIALGLIFGLGAVTTEYVQMFLRRSEAAKFARGYAKLIEEGSLSQCLWYRIPPEARKTMDPDEMMKQFQQSSAREPMMYEEQVRPVKQIQDRVAKGAKVSYFGVVAEALDGLTPIVQARLKVEGPDAGPEDALLIIKGYPGRPVQWSIERVVFPYKPGTPLLR